MKICWVLDTRLWRPADTHELVDQGVELASHNLWRQHNTQSSLHPVKYLDRISGGYPVVEQHPVRHEISQTPHKDGARQHVDDAVLETVFMVIL